MSQFYARYIPPSTSISKVDTVETKPQKRKRTDDAEQRSKQRDGSSYKSKKVKKETESDNKPDLKAADESIRTELAVQNGHNILDRYRVSEAAKSQNQAADVKFRKKPTQPYGKETSVKKAARRDLSSLQEQDELEPVDGNSTASQKHANILSKLSKSRRRASTQHDVFKAESNAEEPEIHGLEPIPQPQAVLEQSSKPTYSTLSTWQSNATTIDRASRKSFEEMGLSKMMLANMRKHNLQKPFPVQSALIPMLLDQPPDIAGDICVSAATGSGKTLAYVVPIVEALHMSNKDGLRAIIVVPTRELVRQVRETCDITASGSSLRIVTAVGSKSLKEEQDALVKIEEVYDPAEYERRQKASINWSTFNLETELKKAQANQHGFLPGYVERTRVKADIMITTPGRLVDHLKNTPGFNLDVVEWLVVDEADRLLNESYQEWIEVVVPALTSRNATKERDQILRRMQFDLPPRVVRKVLLSATMTQDITKLNALGLQDPKLVVLRSTGLSTSVEDQMGDTTYSELNEPEPDAGGAFNLPAALHESVLTFKDGADKPLVLFGLLNNEVFGRTIAPDKQSPDETSSSESTGSESDSDTESSRSSSSASSDETSSLANTSQDLTSDSETSKAGEQLGAPQSNKQISMVAKINNAPRALVFVRSTASASRLSRLLCLLSPVLASKIAILTRSTASLASSRQALSLFRTGKKVVLISTDRASRGIDVPGLENVINYDIPGSALTYVHRVGRTARAGLGGHAWTLLEHREGRWFWNEIGGKNDESKVKRRMKVKKIDAKVEDSMLRERYETALQSLGEEVKG